MHDKQKDCTTKSSQREMHRTAGCLLICNKTCVNMDHYEVIGIVKTGYERLELPTWYSDNFDRYRTHFVPSMEQKAFDTVVIGLRAHAHYVYNFVMIYVVFFVTNATCLT
ncbi:hypothetical protein TNCV_3321851 [Trichonephila clavipes]|nr:hypothetical protein TNCV_3321851 [Trichonephila clavipes]